MVFVAALALLEILEATFRRYTVDGLHFQRWSSEALMQSVSLRDLRAAPIESLWFLHIQPPIYDLIRAILAALHRSASGLDLIAAVDRDLYHVWAATAAALAALIDSWLRAARVPGWMAAVLTVVWLVHPANLAYTTLIDGTVISALLTTVILHQTWRLSRDSTGPIGGLVASVSLAYLTRSLFQWPFVLVMLTSLILLRLPRRALIRFTTAVGLVVALYSVKQVLLFGTVYTSSFLGWNLARAVGADCKAVRPDPHRGVSASGPAVLTRSDKLDGSYNFNHRGRLDEDRLLLRCARRDLARRSATSLAGAFAENLSIYLGPSSRYQPNAMVDRLPWRGPFDWLFSGWRLVGLSLAAAGIGFWRARWRVRLATALVLPFAYVALISVLTERGENMRYKFFLEPTLFVFIASQLFSLTRLSWADQIPRPVRTVETTEGAEHTVS